MEDGVIRTGVKKAGVKRAKFLVEKRKSSVNFLSVFLTVSLISQEK